MAQYHVDYERDASGRWVGSVRDLPGCHTQGRTIAQTRERIREALGLFVDDADAAELVDHIKISVALRKAIARYRATRRQADALAAQVAIDARRAVRALTGDKLSRRDAAEVLGLSHQRVQQLLEDRKGGLH
jgi:predicted RNase H-like HicB family nuclease